MNFNRYYLLILWCCISIFEYFFMILGGPGFATSSGRALHIPRTGPRRRLRLPGSSCIWLSRSWIQALGLDPMEHSLFSWWCLGAWFSSSSAATSWRVVASLLLFEELSQLSWAAFVLIWKRILLDDSFHFSWLGLPPLASRCPGSSPCRRCGRRAPAAAYHFSPNA